MNVVSLEIVSIQDDFHVKPQEIKMNLIMVIYCLKKVLQEDSKGYKTENLVASDSVVPIENFNLEEDSILSKIED